MMRCDAKSFKYKHLFKSCFIPSCFYNKIKVQVLQKIKLPNNVQNATNY
ncbi:hypothetical protein LOK49_LG11G01339 [Camellia lanceoleosa]|uniref:Uncharacterized protein n=1 Tax=Camellia lanceoleosa TaxID=1840588 RepID=A0ACC0G122_9ERIC|nr:hypothetical protein LOK49_LG11G01339 [Camellia lanceoleosa]